MSIVDIRAALEVAIDQMPGLIPSVVIASSTPGNPTVFQTETPHKLKSGLVVEVSGHSGATPDLNGQYFVVVSAANQFTLQHIVTKTPIASTATGVGGVIIAKLTAWEGTTFKPLAGVPMQRVSFIFSEPVNPTYGNGLTRESGFVQVNLYYPNGFGTRDVMTRAQLIKSTFPRGSSFSSNGIIVHISGTPEMYQGLPVEEHFVVPVRIPFWADIFN